jgi:hypothetical protein
LICLKLAFILVSQWVSIKKLCIRLPSHDYDVPGALSHLLRDDFFPSVRELSIELEGKSGHTGETPDWMDSAQDELIGLASWTDQLDKVHLSLRNVAYIDQFAPFTSVFRSIAVRAMIQTGVCW